MYDVFLGNLNFPSLFDLFCFVSLVSGIALRGDVLPLFHAGFPLRAALIFALASCDITLPLFASLIFFLVSSLVR